MADTFNPHEFDINFKTSPSPVPRQREDTAAFNKSYTGFLEGQDTVPQLFDRYNQRYGVPQMEKYVSRGMENSDYLGNQIRGLPNDIAQRSQESILTQGQKNRQVQSESAPLLEQKGMIDQNVSRAQTNLGVARTNVNQALSMEQTQQLKMTQPWLMQHDDNNILNAAEMTGWTFQNSQELDRLLANQSAGVQLTEGERSRMNQLAIAEKGFENAIKLANITAETSRSNQRLANLVALAGQF